MKTFFLVLIFLSYVLVEINANGGHHNKHKRHHDRRDDDWNHHRRHDKDHHDRDDKDHHDRDDDGDHHRRHHERGNHHRRHRNHHDRDDDHHHRRHHNDHRRHHDRRHHDRRHNRDQRGRNHHDREHYEIGLHHVLGKILNKWESKAFHDRFNHHEWNFDARLVGESNDYSHHENNNDGYQGEQQQPRYTSSNPTYQPEDKPTTPNYHSNDDNNVGEDITPYDGNDDFAPQYAPEIPDDNDWNNDTETDNPDTDPAPIDQPNYHNQGNNNNNHDNDNNNTPVPTPKHYKSSNPGKGEGVLTPIKQGKSETGPNHGGDETLGLVDQAPVMPTDTDHEDLNDNEENPDNNNSTMTDIPVPEGLIRNRKKEDSNWVLGLAIGIPAGIVLLALIVAGVLLYRRKQSLVEVEIDVPEKGWVTHT